MTHRTRYLKRCGRMFHGLRRVLTRFRVLDTRGAIQRPLPTTLSVWAEQRRNFLGSPIATMGARLTGAGSYHSDGTVFSRAQLSTRYQSLMFHNSLSQPLFSTPPRL